MSLPERTLTLTLTLIGMQDHHVAARARRAYQGLRVQHGRDVEGASALLLILMHDNICG